MREQRQIGPRRQWVEWRTPNAYSVSVLPPGRERVEPADPIDGISRLVDAASKTFESKCLRCGIVLGRHEYTDEGAYRVSFLHPSLRVLPARHSNGLRHFGPDVRGKSGRTPRRKDSPTQITGMVYVDCPRCEASQAVFGAPTKAVASESVVAV